MDLQRDLLTRILLAALLCLLAVGGYGLYQSHRQQLLQSRQTAQSLASQLLAQWRLRQAGIGMAAPFPDFDTWKQHTPSQPGLCVDYRAEIAGSNRSLCNGDQASANDWPATFANLYRSLFQPGMPLTLPIGENDHILGRLIVTPSADIELSQAWRQIQNLLSLAAATLLAICGLVYLSIRRALQPVQQIVVGLHTLEAGQLDYRLPDFELKQWRQIGAAINQLAASQQQLLEERQSLIGKLQALQEQERREIAGELHDEFGQCLAAISAVTTSIKQTAPMLLDDCERIAEIKQSMQQTIRRMLQRLRPAEWDELGLVASLQALVASWNQHLGGKTHLTFHSQGTIESLNESQALTLFRAAQESLTNIAKHAHASRATVEVSVTPLQAVLKICDDGTASRLPFGPAAGIGLLSLRERAVALGGKLDLSIAEPHGLCLQLSLPIEAP